MWKPAFRGFVVGVILTITLLHGKDSKISTDDAIDFATTSIQRVDADHDGQITPWEILKTAWSSYRLRRL